MSKNNKSNGVNPNVGIVLNQSAPFRGYSDINGVERQAVPGAKFRQQFKDMFSKDVHGNIIWNPDYYNPALSRNIEPVKYVQNDMLVEGLVSSPNFWHNQRNLQDYYASLGQSELYPGMFEAIGRATIYAAQFVESPFLKYLKDPITQGNAVMSGYFTEVESRKWNIKGAPEVAGVPTAKEPIFTAQLPSLKTSVARLEFVREIAIKINAQHYAQYCQTPEMVGQVATALHSQAHATATNDMFIACNEYFCGILRIFPEPTTAYIPDQAATSFRMNPENLSPMIAVVPAIDQQFDCDVDKLWECIHNTLDVDFYYMHKEYNPYGRNTCTRSASVFMDKHYLFRLFKKKFSDTFHPEYLKPQVDFEYVDEFPPLALPPFGPQFKLIGMIVDNDGPAIYPQGAGVTTGSFYNPQEESISLFNHYKYILEHKPFTNRKYIYLKAPN